MANESDFRIEESDLELPPSDARDTFVKEIEALCRELIETTHKLHDEQNERMIGRLEERWFTLRREIFSKQERSYLDHGYYIDIPCTKDSLPIRVNKLKKMTPWGKPAV